MSEIDLEYLEDYRALDIPLEVARIILQQEMEVWKNTRFMYLTKRDVQVSIKGSTTAIDAKLEEAAGAMIVLKAKLAALDELANELKAKIPTSG